MAEMGLGYGSEYQLLRALGHHRCEFFKIIKSALGTEEPIEWIDYPTNTNRLSLDGEYCEIEVFKNEPFYAELEKKWSDFWPAKGSKAQNWDGVFKIEDEWYFVEAKAHTGELKDTTDRHKLNANSQKLIASSFQKSIDTIHADSTGEQWLYSPYYQYANRLAFSLFLRENGIKAHVVNILFINGYEKPKKTRKNIVESKSARTIQDWEIAIKEEEASLGISSSRLEDLSYTVIVDSLFPLK